jgi:hypothetical protein
MFGRKKKKNKKEEEEEQMVFFLITFSKHTAHNLNNGHSMNSAPIAPNAFSRISSRHCRAT